ncbi:hypothetical protein E1301_Tti011794 [Triplophysa tibetana]|uniref:Transposase domain-containing protein n=1 Tax=Triplophysa tibetana TaxID=1572043 RepID=A0A5A9NIW7_9TELE|nr:hypothetical protein E1301_Tti011794 [Triplophysa tibetana]
MDSKSKRQRYTRQWKYARRSLDEGPVEKERLDHPLTPQEGYAERMDIDDDISSSVGTVDVGFIGSCSSGHETVNNALNEETESVNEMASTSLPTFLQEWSIKHNITHNALDDLLKGLKRNGHPELPSTARTLLKTPRTVTSSQKSGMECVHFNLRESLSDQLKRYPTEMIERVSTLELSFNIDGLPIFKSSRTHLWPILCAIHLNPISVFPVTLTLGPTKPKDLEFAEEAINDIQELLDNGLDGKNIRIRCFVCDAPARAMVKKIKQYSGYFGCDKCTQKGTWISGRVTYPEVDNLTLRTNEAFRAEMAIQMSTSPLSVVTSRSKTKRPNNAFILAEGKCCEAIEERNESDDSVGQSIGITFKDIIDKKSNFILTDGHKTVCSGGIFRRQFGRNCPHLMVGGEQRGSYNTAVEKCSRVVETSNIETEDTTRTKKRAQKKPKRFLSDKDSSSSDDCRVLAKKKSEKSICKPVPPKYYRTKVLQKLQDIVENQQEILAMQRQLLASTAVTRISGLAKRHAVRTMSGSRASQ